jgi:predicted transcriptional regulator of viral defense system
MSTTPDQPLGIKATAVVEALRRSAVLSARDLVSLGISREYLRKLVAQGVVERAARGLYELPNADISVHHTTVQAARRVPHGVVCLVSALRFHQVTTQIPHEVWMAIEAKARRPKVTDIPIRIMYSSGPAFYEGIDEHLIEGVPLRVYSLGKTVADCFKYRNKVGLDVALEALREVLRHRRASVNQIWHFAKVCRVANVMRPYLESLL